MENIQTCPHVTVVAFHPLSDKAASLLRLFIVFNNNNNSRPQPLPMVSVYPLYIRGQLLFTTIEEEEEEEEESPSIVLCMRATRATTRQRDTEFSETFDRKSVHAQSYDDTAPAGG